MFLAVPTVAFLSWALIHAAPLGVDGWRWVAGFPVLGAVLIWWIRRQVPESPRWLAEQGHLSEANDVLRRIETRIEAQIGRPLDPPAEVDVTGQSSRGGTLRELLAPPFRRRTIMLAVFNFFQTIGFYGFGNWVPRLISGQGVSIADSLLYSFVIAIAYPAGPFLFTLFADRLERKWQIVLACSGTAVFGLLFAQQRAAWTIITLGILITLSNNLMSYAYHTYQAEVFPTRIRSRAVGFVYSFSRLSSIFTSFLIAFFLREFGTAGVFAFISLSMFVAASAVGFFGPRTRGRGLEEIADEDGRGQRGPTPARYLRC